MGGVSVLLALTLSQQYIGFAGWSYFLFGPLLGLHGFARGARQRKLEDRAAAASPA